MRAATTMGAIALLVACGTNSDLPTSPSVSVVGDTTKVELPVQMAVTVGAVTIRFDAVAGDSRCPIGVECVWAGNGEIQLTLTASSDSETANLNTGVEPHEVEFGGYLIRLTDLAPHPVYLVPTDPSASVAYLSVIEAP